MTKQKSYKYFKCQSLIFPQDLAINRQLLITEIFLLSTLQITYKVINNFHNLVRIKVRNGGNYTIIHYNTWISNQLYE